MFEDRRPRYTHIRFHSARIHALAASPYKAQAAKKETKIVFAAGNALLRQIDLRVILLAARAWAAAEGPERYASTLWANRKPERYNSNRNMIRV
jgi:hypothetical protein